MTKEYIERETLIRHLNNELEACGDACIDSQPIVYGTILGLKGAMSYANTLPAPDVVEVVHGVWKMAVDEADYEYGTCSECGNREYDAFCTGRIPNYCSNCGAKMDGERKEQE